MLEDEPSLPPGGWSGRRKSKPRKAKLVDVGSNLPLGGDSHPKAEVDPLFVLRSATSFTDDLAVVTRKPGRKQTTLKQGLNVRFFQSDARYPSVDVSWGPSHLPKKDVVVEVHAGIRTNERGLLAGGSKEPIGSIAGAKWMLEVALMAGYPEEKGGMTVFEGPADSGLAERPLSIEFSGGPMVSPYGNCPGERMKGSVVGGSRIEIGIPLSMRDKGRGREVGREGDGCCDSPKEIAFCGRAIRDDSSSTSQKGGDWISAFPEAQPAPQGDALSELRGKVSENQRFERAKLAQGQTPRNMINPK